MKGRISTPNNGKTRRIDMSSQLTETLWMLKHERKREMGSNMPEWDFLNESGVPLNETHWRRDIFNKALDKVEIRHIRTHDLRHSYTPHYFYKLVSLWHTYGINWGITA